MIKAILKGRHCRIYTAPTFTPIPMCIRHQICKKLPQEKLHMTEVRTGKERKFKEIPRVCGVTVISSHHPYTVILKVL